MADIFDVIQNKETYSFKEYEEKKPNVLRRIGKGVAVGASDLIDAPRATTQGILTAMLGPSVAESDLTPAQLEQIKRELYAPSEKEFIQSASSDDDIIGMPYLPKGAENLKSDLGVQPDESDIAQEIPRRVVRSAPFGVQGIVSDLLGLGGKEAASMAGFGETGQTFADLALSLGNPAGPYKTPKKYEEAATLLKRAGSSIEDIIPALQADKYSSKFTTKFASRGKETQEALTKTRDSLGEVYKYLRKQPEASKIVSKSNVDQFTQTIESKINELPQKSRKKIKDDITKFNKSNKSVVDFMQLQKDINAAGDYRLSPLKKPIMEVLKKESPSIYKDLKTADQLYSKYAKINKQLKPNTATDFIEASLPLRAMAGVLMGQPLLLREAIGEAAVKKLSTKMLTNPKYQNISRSMVTSINSGKVKASQALLEQMIAQVAKDSPETAQLLRQIEPDEFAKFLEIQDDVN